MEKEQELINIGRRRRRGPTIADAASQLEKQWDAIPIGATPDAEQFRATSERLVDLSRKRKRPVASPVAESIAYLTVAVLNPLTDAEIRRALSRPEKKALVLSPKLH